MLTNDGGRSEIELALWMLERMRNSQEFLAVIRAARVAGKSDVLDTPDHVVRHKGRLKELYQSDSDETVETPASLAGAMDAIAARDLLSGREELIEKALEAYLELHPEGARGLPAGWQTTFDMAVAEVEGRTSGEFHPGFVTELATAARAELERQAEPARAAGRDDRDR